MQGEPLLESTGCRPGRGRVLYLQGMGDTSNAAVAAARRAPRPAMSAPSARIGGAAFLELWAREGVDAAAVIRRADAPTGLYVVTHDARGHHFAFYRSGSAAARYRPEEVPEAAIRAARMLHVSGISQAISDSACDAVFHAMTVARSAGVRVSYDTNLRLRCGRRRGRRR